MKKQFSKRIGAILTMAAMLMALLPVAMPVMAEEATSYTTGDGQYIPVQELEHYALTVDNTDYKDEVITVTVAFKSKAEDGSYSDVSIKAMKYYSTSTGTAYSSIDRYMGGDDNTFNFTTPKNCNCITVTAQLETSLSLPITLVITNEVLNNGTLIRTGGSGSSNTVGGWYVANTKWHDDKNGYFNMSSTSSTNVSQILTLKAGSTYRLKFKYAQTENDKLNPRLYFDKLIGTFESLPGRANGQQAYTNVWEVAPTDSTWKEYETYFVAKASGDQTTYPGTEGLVQTRMLPRSYNSTGTVYYDDFSISEVDEGSYIWYVRNSDGAGVSGIAAAASPKSVRYHYVQKTAGQTQKLINVKYDNGAISDVEVIDVGKDLAVGESANYDITIGSDTSKIFLWDGATLTPQRDPIENYVITE